MIEGKRVLGIIPARGGSKGVSRKNIRHLAGKPLIAWTIEEALKSRFIDRLILSSDDEEIIKIAKEWGCEAPFVRPAELSKDDTPGITPVLHAIEELPGFDYVVLLQPTSPLRIVDDIDGCIEKCLRSSANVSVSVTEVDQTPYWMYFIGQSGEMTPVLQKDQLFTRRQQLPIAYTLNGAVYAAEIESLKKSNSFLVPSTMAYIMPKERSIDIDTEFDLVMAEQLIYKQY